MRPLSDRLVSRALLALAAVTFAISIGTPLLGLRVFHGADMLLDRAPWRVTSPEVQVATNPVVGDTVSTFMPLHAEVRRRLWGADLPLWTTYPAGGLPLAIVPDAGSLGPLNAPYVLLPLSYAPGLAKLLELAAAMGFTFLFLRRLGLSTPASLAGGFVYSMSGFQVVWTNWPQSHVGALIPALFWTVDRAVARPQLVAGIPVAIAVAAMVFEGFPSVAGYALLAVGVYAVIRVLAHRGMSARSRSWTFGLLAGAVAVGLGLTALQAFPLSDRVGELDLGYRVQSPRSHLPLSALLTMAVPNAFGSPVGGDYAGPLNYVEIQAFVGASSLVAVVAAAAWRTGRPVVRGARSFLWATAAVTAVLLFLGGPPLAALQATGLFHLNFVGRLRSVLGFVLAALVAVGLDAAAARTRERPSRARAIGVWATAAVIAGLGLWRLWAISGDAGRRSEVLGAAAVPVLAAGVAAVAVWLARSEVGRRASSALLVVPLAFAVEALIFAVPFWPRIPREDFYPTTPAHVALRQGLGADRLAGAGGAMFPGTTTFFGIRSLTTNNTLPQLPVWEDLIRAVDPDAFDQSPVFPSLAPRQDVATSPILDRLSVRYFVTPPNLPVFGRRVPVAAPAGGTLELVAGDTLERALPTGVLPIRAILLPVAAPLELPAGGRITAEIVDAAGTTLAAGEQIVFDGEGPGIVQVLIPEQPCSGACRPPLAARITLAAPSGQAVVAAAADSGPGLSVVRAVDDGLRLEVVDNVAGYRRLHALPRIRWAGRARVAPSAPDRVELLEAGLEPDEVLLSEPGPDGSGATAEVEVLEDSGDVIRARVTASGGGYLVVADPLQEGWAATVDGGSEELRAADHALVTVFVPAGEHQIVLRYDPPAWRTGQIVSAVSVAVLASVGFLGRHRRAERTGLPRRIGRG